MNLFQEALLVRPSIRQAGISARSRILSREAAEAHEADSDRVRGIVQILSKEALSPLVKIVNEARSFHIANTLPWGDNGERLIPVTRYAHWKREMTRFQSDFMDEVDSLVGQYPALRKDYVRSVNDLAQEIQFPSLEEFKGNFDFAIIETPLANPADLRLKHVDPKTVEELKDKILNSQSVLFEEAHKDIINRLFKVVARVHEQTSKEDGRLFQSLVTNIEEAVDVLPKLNLKNDPEITRLISRVRTELASIDVETLRTNSKERAKTSKLAGQILTDLKSYGKAKPKPVAATPIAAKSIKSRFANVTL